MSPGSSRSWGFQKPGRRCPRKVCPEQKERTHVGKSSHCLLPLCDEGREHIVLLSYLLDSSPATRQLSRAYSSPRVRAAGLPNRTLPLLTVPVVSVDEWGLELPIVPLAPKVLFQNTSSGKRPHLLFRSLPPTKTRHSTLARSLSRLIEPARQTSSAIVFGLTPFLTFCSSGDSAQSYRHNHIATPTPDTHLP